MAAATDAGPSNDGEWGDAWDTACEAGSVADISRILTALNEAKFVIGTRQIAEGTLTAWRADPNTLDIIMTGIRQLQKSGRVPVRVVARLFARIIWMAAAEGELKLIWEMDTYMQALLDSAPETWRTAWVPHQLKRWVRKSKRPNTLFFRDLFTGQWVSDTALERAIQYVIRRGDVLALRAIQGTSRGGAILNETAVDSVLEALKVGMLDIPAVDTCPSMSALLMPVRWSMRNLSIFFHRLAAWLESDPPTRLVFESPVLGQLCIDLANILKSSTEGAARLHVRNLAIVLASGRVPHAAVVDVAKLLPAVGPVVQNLRYARRSQMIGARGASQAQRYRAAIREFVATGAAVLLPLGAELDTYNRMETPDARTIAATLYDMVKTLADENDTLLAVQAVASMRDTTVSNLRELYQKARDGAQKIKTLGKTAWDLVGRPMPEAAAAAHMTELAQHSAAAVEDGGSVSPPSPKRIRHASELDTASSLLSLAASPARPGAAVSGEAAAAHFMAAVGGAKRSREGTDELAQGDGAGKRAATYDDDARGFMRAAAAGGNGLYPDRGTKRPRDVEQAFMPLGGSAKRPAGAAEVDDFMKASLPSAPAGTASAAAVGGSKRAREGALLDGASAITAKRAATADATAVGGSKRAREGALLNGTGAITAKRAATADATAVGGSKRAREGAPLDGAGAIAAKRAATADAAELAGMPSAGVPPRRLNTAWARLASASPGAAEVSHFMDGAAASSDAAPPVITAQSPSKAAAVRVPPVSGTAGLGQRDGSAIVVESDTDDE